jgi:hypothetical protein
LEAVHKVVGLSTRLGGKYDPRETNLQVEALNGQLESARQAVDETIAFRTQLDDRINERKQTFEQLPQLASSVLRLLEVRGVSPEKLDDVRSCFKQLTGRSPRSRAPVAGDQALAQGKARRSVGQAAYVHKADAFARFVAAVATVPGYGANVPELSLESLVARTRELDRLNDRVSEARTEWVNSLVRRDRAMYDGPDAAVANARRAKKYIRAVFGLQSAEYAQVKGLVFTKPGK